MKILLLSESRLSIIQHVATVEHIVGERRIVFHTHEDIEHKRVGTEILYSDISKTYLYGAYYRYTACRVVDDVWTEPAQKKCSQTL